MLNFEKKNVINIKFIFKKRQGIANEEFFFKKNNPFNGIDQSK